VQAFLQKLGEPSKDLNDTTSSVDPPPPGESTDDGQNELEHTKMTPLARYVAKKLSAKKTKLRLEGVFQHSILCMQSRSEWVAAKSIDLLAEAGYKESDLPFMASMKGKPALETELKSAVFTGKVPLGSKPELVAQVLRVIEFVIKYFTKQGDEDSDSEEEEAATLTTASGKRSGVGDLLKKLNGEEKAKEREVKESVPEQPPWNPWSNMWDHLQVEAFKTLTDLKTFLGKCLLRQADDKLAEKKKEFDVAQDMVSCLVLAGYSHGSLVQMVMQAPANEDILPPTSSQKDSSKKTYVYDVILERLKRMRLQLPPLSDLQLDYLVRKSLTYVARGCGRTLTPTRAPRGGPNIVFNYLPPGLREMENSVIKPESAKDGMKVVELEREEEKEEETTEGSSQHDPLNSILKPRTAADELPRRKYLTGCVHAAWLSLNGRAHIYELNVFMSDHTSLTVYSVPAAVQKRPELMEALGFVANPDREEFYFVQVGVGVVKAVTATKAISKLVHFLEEKRNAGSENRNNGVVLSFFNDEDMAVVTQAVEDAGHKSLFLETVKGLGTLSAFMEANRGKKLVFNGPDLNIGDTESYFRAEVRRSLQSAELIAKSMAESIHQALEYFVGEQVDFDNYVHSYCNPSLGARASECKRRLKSYFQLYPLEVFVASRLTAQRGAELRLEGAFAPPAPSGRKELADRASVVAARFCRLLVEAGHDMRSLRTAHDADVNFALSSSVILDRGPGGAGKRLQVMDQTMRCITHVREYFNRPGEDEEAAD